MRPAYYFFAILMLAAWCVMTTTHELGHLIGGWLSGGTLQHAELCPWRLPHSHFAPDPHPLITLWAGPLLGCAIPLAFALAIGKPSTWLVANFCVLANGVYLALAWYSGAPFLDTPRLLAAGASPLSIAAYCAVTIGWGYPALRASIVDIVFPKRGEGSGKD
ncbi:hypothetical protein Pla52o_12810 [Novipirellula galeiformis]|uniref:Peptidase family M50 n=1 Tax=Novipirellula galeiformis TaxID=2528004 RepID=A0A5C6CNE5_9BACT|nr:hypothetical protein [Novipirellula galeiformis]TWU24984.1 hypothetical protein Pla52o_12810 [Novipirellula galeiformis]